MDLAIDDRDGDTLTKIVKTVEDAGSSVMLVTTFKDLKAHRAYFMFYWPLAVKYTMKVFDKLG